MKVLKLFILLICLCLIVSCSSEEDDGYDFTGNWNLFSITFLNTGSASNQYTLNKAIDADENCLFESTLTILPNNTALLKLTSKVSVAIEVIEGTTTELDQIITCENEEEVIFLSWKSRSPDGYNYIDLMDENGTIVMGGFVTPDNTLGIGPSSIYENPIIVEIEGEEIEFTNGKFFIFNR